MKYIKHVAYVLYVVLLLVAGVALFVFGISTFTTTALFYSAIVLIVLLATGFFSSKSNSANLINYRVLGIAICGTLLLGEATLRFVIKQHLTFNEYHGKPYMSDYKKCQKQNFRLNRLMSGNVNWTKTNIPNSTRFIARDEFEYSHKYNSFGLRDDEWVTDATDTVYRVIGLGDSFTEGVGTHQDSTWLKHFEREINSNKLHKRVKTFNAGISGSDVFFEYQLLLKLLDTIKPSLVIVSINSTDIDECIIRGGMNRFKPDGKVLYNPAPWWESFYAVSFIARAVINTTIQPDWTLYNNVQKEVKTKAAIDSIANCLQLFSAMAQQQKFHLVVLFTPLEKEVKDANFAFSPMAAELALDTTITIVNLLDEYNHRQLITPQNSSMYYWPVDLHHNNKGYKTWGDLVAAILIEKKVVE